MGFFPVVKVKEIVFVLLTSSSQVCHRFEITIEFQSFIQTYPVLLPPPLPSPDGSITGAMLRELLKLSLSVCVSSSVQAEPSNLLTTQEKKRANEEEKHSLLSPNDARWEPSSARFCWAALLTPTPVLFLAAPGLRFSDTAILGLSAWWGPSSCLQQKKSRGNQIVK